MSSDLKNITVTYLRHFRDCPVKWYLHDKSKDKKTLMINDLRKVITYFFCHAMTDRKTYSTKKTLKKKIIASSNISNKKQAAEWIYKMSDNFQKFSFDIRCINLPFQLTLMENICIMGTIDLVKKTPYGPDIVMYDFDNKPDYKAMKKDPTYIIYIMALTQYFKNDINSIYVYNFPQGKLIDISRDSETMNYQIDIIRDMLEDIRAGNIKPKVSLKCDECPVKRECFKKYAKIHEKVYDK